MFHRPNDPRFRRTLNNLSQNIEAANETAQEGIFTFGQRFINPCVSSIGNCFHSCTATCFPTKEERRRRNRGRARGRPELSFDFYDDWDQDEDLGWGNDELDRLLGGSGPYASTTAQPNRQRAMSYGTRKDRPRRKSAVLPHDGGPDPTVIPTTSYFGFLGRLPWNQGKGLKYKPSAADLQEHPGAARETTREQEPLLEESEEEAYVHAKRTHKRQRSQTNSSGHTTDSLSSRGDIFPSEDEIDDAVPLDDEFAMNLVRRNTNLGLDDASSGKVKSGKQSVASRSTRTVSSKSIQDSSRRTREVTTPDAVDPDQDMPDVPTLSELKAEERRIQDEEEAEIERKRDAARRLALKRGLSQGEVPSSPASESKPEVDIPSSPPLSSPVADYSLPLSPIVHQGRNETNIPFPSFDRQSPAGNDSKEDIAAPASPSPGAPKQEPDLEFVPARLPRFSSDPD